VIAPRPNGRPNGRTRIGQLLREQGLVDDDQLRSALAHQMRWGGRLGRSLLVLRFVGEQALLHTLSRQLGVPLVHIGQRHVPPEVLARVPAKLVLARCLLPLEIVRERRYPRLVVAFANPEDLHLRDEVAFAAGLEVLPVLAGEEDLQRAIANHFSGTAAGRGRGSDGIELPDEPAEPMRLVDGRDIHH